MTPKNSAHHPASFRDPGGFLFTRGGVLYRQVNEPARAGYQALMSSGLYKALRKKGWIIPHEEVDQKAEDPAKAWKVLQPEPLSFISYPYEWSFSQLKDAALLTLTIHKAALKAGLSLKDASAYNIQFHHGQPLLVDTLSFEPYQEGQPWVAYRQFCQHFLAPLALMSHVDVRLSQLLRVYIDGVPLDLVSNLLPGRTKLDAGLQAHIHLHARVQQQHAADAGKDTRQATISLSQQLALIENLAHTVAKLSWKAGGSEWADYYNITNYSDEAMQAKHALVADFIRKAAPKTVWDLGGNDGTFSRIASQMGIFTLSADIDPAAVERNYLQLKESGEDNLHPLLLDLTNPSPSQGWAHTERDSLETRGPADLVMALALIHHLAISNNLPLEHIARYFARLGEWLLIEFVPKEDSQVQILLATREDIFPHYNLEDFRSAFAEVYRIDAEQPVQGSQRTLFLMKRK